MAFPRHPQLTQTLCALLCTLTVLVACLLGDLFTQAAEDLAAQYRTPPAATQGKTHTAK